MLRTLWSVCVGSVLVGLAVDSLRAQRPGIGDAMARPVVIAQSGPPVAAPVSDRATPIMVPQQAPQNQPGAWLADPTPTVTITQTLNATGDTFQWTNLQDGSAVILFSPEKLTIKLTGAKDPVVTWDFDGGTPSNFQGTDPSKLSIDIPIAQWDKSKTLNIKTGKDPTGKDATKFVSLTLSTPGTSPAPLTIKTVANAADGSFGPVPDLPKTVDVAKGTVQVQVPGSVDNLAALTFTQPDASSPLYQFIAPGSTPPKATAAAGNLTQVTVTLPANLPAGTIGRVILLSNKGAAPYAASNILGIRTIPTVRPQTVSQTINGETFVWKFTDPLNMLSAKDDITVTGTVDPKTSSLKGLLNAKDSPVTGPDTNGTWTAVIPATSFADSSPPKLQIITNDASKTPVATITLSVPTPSDPKTSPFSIKGIANTSDGTFTTPPPTLPATTDVYQGSGLLRLQVNGKADCSQPVGFVKDTTSTTKPTFNYSDLSKVQVASGGADSSGNYEVRFTLPDSPFLTSSNEGRVFLMSKATAPYVITDPVGIKAAPAPPTAAVTKVSQTVGTDTFTWKISGAKPAVAVISNSVDIKVSGTYTGETNALTGNLSTPDSVPVNLDKPNKTWNTTVPTAKLGAAAKQTLTITDVNCKVLATIDLSIPSKGDPKGDLTFKSDVNTLNVSFPTAAATGPLDMYKGFLRIQVTGNTAGVANASPPVVAFSKNLTTGEFEFVDVSKVKPTVGTADANGNTEISFTLPDPPFQTTGIEGRVVVEAVLAPTYIATVPVAVKAADAPNFDPPTFVKIGGKALSSKNTVYLNVTQFPVLISPAPADRPGLVSLVFQQGQSAPQTTTNSSTDASGTTFTIDLKNEGQYSLLPTFVRGNVTAQPANPTIVVIKKTGPQVSSVNPTNLASTPQSDQITVKFNPENPLDPKSAQDPLNYQLVSKTGTQAARNPGTVLYFPDTNSVLLQFGALPADTYTLKILAKNPGTTPQTAASPPAPVATTGASLSGGSGIQDVFGNYVGTDAFNPNGVSYTADIAKPVGSDLPPIGPGIRAPTWPYIEFQEYTAPRTNPNGFNPSDHVETRVVQLYYYRDAHRVAQIINREAKSYNRIAVDERRRVAEKARDAAVDASVKRQVAERQAVQAAQDARHAEKKLAEMQSQLAVAQNNAAIAQQQQNGTDLAAAAAQSKVTAATAAVQQNTDPNQKASLQAALDNANAQLAQANLIAAQTKAQNQQVQQQVADWQTKVNKAVDDVKAARTQETNTSETWQEMQAAEDRARADQFRQEVAAAHEDPDTYAPGKPLSDDPVRQVSISVIGEAVIQLRGPMKGINIIRKMINEIDSPVGQVRISIHTVQVNGEHGDRMEKVAGRIQDYIDHSRFLTVQSAQMLRNAVVKIASQKAEEVAIQCPMDSQDVRDTKYMYAFFGKDFIDELRALDSEFLKSSNKLLSLHAMDTTSLASALFVLGLAKNSTRIEIITDFRRQMNESLPVREQSYFDAGGCRPNGNSCWWNPADCCDKFQLLANNAKFESFIGFFDAEISGDDTLCPMQREFIRLAQIFKTRLVTELEYNQRVMERALIEDRMGNYLQDLKAAKDKEQAAKQNLEKAQETLIKQQAAVLTTSQLLTGVGTQLKADLATCQRIVEQLEVLAQTVRQSQAQAKEISQQTLDFAQPVLDLVRDSGTGAKATVGVNGTLILSDLNGNSVTIPYTVLPDGSLSFSPPDETRLRGLLVDGMNYGSSVLVQIQPYNINPLDNKILDQATQIYNAFQAILDPKVTKLVLNLGKFQNLNLMFQSFSEILSHIKDEVNSLTVQLTQVTNKLSAQTPDVPGAAAQWALIKQEVDKRVKPTSQTTSIILTQTATLNTLFTTLLNADTERRAAEQLVALARRPLDHKKLLDMLIDDVEDKYIELLEGTRAHVANIDAYVKRLATALDDDFNTQFYFPAFREVRTASRMWDVTFGQIETTGILANNRMFAKVDPQATMEFDLPKRDILIVEAMKGAKGLIDQYGALINDPTFLALTKMGAGQSTASVAQGAGGGQPDVRSVLPGLPRTADQTPLTQTAPGGQQLASPLEALIPEPAIYKFETGTGYEIIPVIQPDGQSVVFHFNYMYTTNVREPVHADEKHLGRIKRHFIDTDVQLGNYELREISRYQVALKAARTSRGVPLLEDIPGLGILFRPLPQAESALQENIVLGQATIFPTLFDLMGLRWAPAVADVGALEVENQEFSVRNRRRDLMNRVFDISASSVDSFLQIPEAERRADLYRSQETIPVIHPNGYQGPGLNLRDSQLEEGYDPRKVFPENKFVPADRGDGSLTRPPSPAPVSPRLSAPRQVPPYPPPLVKPADPTQPMQPMVPMQPMQQMAPPQMVPMLPMQQRAPGVVPVEPAPVLPAPRPVPQGQQGMMPGPGTSGVVQASYTAPPAQWNRPPAGNAVKPPPAPQPQPQSGGLLRFLCPLAPKPAPATAPAPTNP